MPAKCPWTGCRSRPTYVGVRRVYPTRRRLVRLGPPAHRRYGAVRILRPYGRRFGGLRSLAPWAGILVGLWLGVNVLTPSSGFGATPRPTSGGGRLDELGLDPAGPPRTRADLQRLMRVANRRHFGNRIESSIGWMPPHRAWRAGQRLVLGEHILRSALVWSSSSIRLNPAYKDRRIPSRALQCTIVHEMVHAERPWAGHSRAFWRRVHAWPDYTLCRRWEGRHRRLLYSLAQRCASGDCPG